MKVYPRKKISYFSELFVAMAFCLLLVVAFFLFMARVYGADKSFLVKLVIGIVLIFVFVIYKSKKTDLDDRSVTVGNDKIGFNSFRLGSGKAENCEIHVSDIKSIVAMKTPFGNVRGIRIKTKLYTNDFKISRGYEDYKVFCCEVTEMVKTKNLEAYVDEKLLDFAQECKITEFDRIKQ